jgi:hypothetical protein
MGRAGKLRAIHPDEAHYFARRLAVARPVRSRRTKCLIADPIYT